METNREQTYTNTKYQNTNKKRNLKHRIQIKTNKSKKTKERKERKKNYNHSR